MSSTCDDRALREQLEEGAETIETEDGEYLAVDIDVAMQLIKARDEQRERAIRIDELQLMSVHMNPNFSQTDKLMRRIDSLAHPPKREAPNE